MADSSKILAEIDPIEDIATVDLGDKRRNARYAQIMVSLMHQPDRTLPQLRSNGPPAWLVLGRGWQRLMVCERAFTLGLQAKGKM